MTFNYNEHFTDKNFNGKQQIISKGTAIKPPELSKFKPQTVLSPHDCANKFQTNYVMYPELHIDEV